MLTHRSIKRVLIMILMMGLYPLIGWAAPMDMTDDELDAIYAQGIFVDIAVNVNLPGGGMLNMPSFNVPFPDIAGVTGSLNGGNGSISVSPTDTGGSNAAATPTPPVTTVSAPTNSSSTTSSTTPNVIPVTAGVSIAEGAMQGNSGLIINAPAAAVSLVINVAVFNNSVLNGNLSQSVNSLPTTLLMSFSTSFR